MTVQNDLVSVIIPVFNSEKFLKESINSVLDQTYPHIEIIAIDDGSTDTSLEILKSYSDSITVLSQKNNGLANSLTSALEKITGRWFKWFSPDDVLNSNAIEILVKEAKKLPENTIIYSNWELINENGKKLRDFHESNYNNLSNFDFNVRLLDGQQINVNTTLVSSSLLEKGCQIRKLNDPIAIDYDFFLRAGILFNTKFHLVTQSLLKYRIHQSQLSHKNISKSLKYIEEIKNEVLSNLEPTQKEKYETALKKYNKNKSIPKKTMDAGLKLLVENFPESVSDQILTLYLNKIRRTR